MIEIKIAEIKIEDIDNLDSFSGVSSKAVSPTQLVNF